MTQPTQTRHPWRATARTVAAATFAAVPVLPIVVDQLGVGSVPLVAAVIAVCGAVTRVLAIPDVDAWLARYVPWLAAQPAPKDPAA